MFESYLGEDSFRAGIRTHMQRFPYGVADVEDFMASLAEGSGRPDVVPAFRSFIDQPGVPLVTRAARVRRARGGARALRSPATCPSARAAIRSGPGSCRCACATATRPACGKQCMLLKDAEATRPAASRRLPGLCHAERGRRGLLPLRAGRRRLARADGELRPAERARGAGDGRQPVGGLPGQPPADRRLCRRDREIAGSAYLQAAMAPDARPHPPARLPRAAPVRRRPCSP